MLLSEIMAGISIIVGGIAIVGFFSQRRRLVMDDGKRLQEVCQMQKDAEAILKRVERLEDAERSINVILAEVKNDLKHMISTLERIATRLDMTPC